MRLSSTSDLEDLKAAPLWLRKAARWPVAFAQVREDPRLDLAVLRTVRMRPDVVMIASGGDTAACLAREPLKSLTLVDTNPAQLALCCLKLHLANALPPSRNLELLGHHAMDSGERRQQLAGLLDKLGLPHDVFGPEESVAAVGPDHAGRYEWLFAALREALMPCRAALAETLRSPEPFLLGRKAHGMLLEAALIDALQTVMARPHLVALFGKDATQNPRQAFHQHFAARVRQAIAEHSPARNPFLWQMFGGIFPPGVCYDWLESAAPLQVSSQCIQGRMSETLASMPAESVDFLHLSNILDWLGEEEAAQCLRRAARVLRPGGVVVLRQLNSTLAVPDLPCGLRWDGTFGAELHAQDRSFFYSAIHVGYRR